MCNRPLQHTEMQGKKEAYKTESRQTAKCPAWLRGRIASSIPWSISFWKIASSDCHSNSNRPTGPRFNCFLDTREQLVRDKLVALGSPNLQRQFIWVNNHLDLVEPRKPDWLDPAHNLQNQPDATPFCLQMKMKPFMSFQEDGLGGSIPHCSHSCHRHSTHQVLQTRTCVSPQENHLLAFASHADISRLHIAFSNGQIAHSLGRDRRWTRNGQIGWSKAFQRTIRMTSFGFGTPWREHARLGTTTQVRILTNCRPEEQKRLLEGDRTTNKRICFWMSRIGICELRAAWSDQFNLHWHDCHVWNDNQSIQQDSLAASDVQLSVITRTLPLGLLEWNVSVKENGSSFRSFLMFRKTPIKTFVCQERRVCLQSEMILLSRVMVNFVILHFLTIQICDKI